MQECDPAIDKVVPDTVAFSPDLQNGAWRIIHINRKLIRNRGLVNALLPLPLTGSPPPVKNNLQFFQPSLNTPNRPSSSKPSTKPEEARHLLLFSLLLNIQDHPPRQFADSVHPISPTFALTKGFGQSIR